MSEIDLIDEDGIPTTIERDEEFRISDVVVCPECGKPEERWCEDEGRGYPFGGQVFCCRGCAEETGCACD
jgi:hypothetical protein